MFIKLTDLSTGVFFCNVEKIVLFHAGSTGTVVAFDEQFCRLVQETPNEIELMILQVCKR